MADLFRVLTELKAGQTVALEYYRGDDMRSGEVTLGIRDDA